MDYVDKESGMPTYKPFSLFNSDFLSLQWELRLKKSPFNQ